MNSSNRRAMCLAPISAIVLTKNESNALPACLASLNFCSEVFVVDSASADGTQQIALRSGASVVQFEWNGAYPKKKEWALANLPFGNDWILYIDADERVPDELAAEMTRAVTEGDGIYAAFSVRLEYEFAGRRLRHGHRVTKVILVRRTQTSWPRVDDLGARNMWEVEGHYQPDVDGPIARLRSELIHDDPGSLYEYFARHNRYTDWEAHLRARHGQPSSRRTSARAFSRLPLRPLLFFIYSFIVRRGFLDGRAGFDYSIANAFYYWQVGLKTRMR